MLNKGEVYISPVTGWYVGKSEFEKGVRFSGIVRLATPVFDKQGFAGMIVLALDYRHLAEFTNHIIPTQQERVSSNSCCWPRVVVACPNQRILHALLLILLRSLILLH